MAKPGIGIWVFRSVSDRNSGKGFRYFNVYFIGCRFRFRSAFNSYSVACSNSNPDDSEAVERDPTINAWTHEKTFADVTMNRTRSKQSTADGQTLSKCRANEGWPGPGSQG
ncbi:hypothetical protein L484_028044 [Morus notabilis]|uniref:Uncharacterized protein n=1 Tax=Morus notabilis TaxID=981085 RepID=W9S7T4_9ROSA|nr:hypothetical protein L484_028044 [Morus notabilis]